MLPADVVASLFRQTISLRINYYLRLVPIYLSVEFVAHVGGSLWLCHAWRCAAFLIAAWMWPDNNCERTNIISRCLCYSKFNWPSDHRPITEQWFIASPYALAVNVTFEYSMTLKSVLHCFTYKPTYMQHCNGKATFNSDRATSAKVCQVTFTDSINNDKAQNLILIPVYVVIIMVHAYTV